MTEVYSRHVDVTNQSGYGTRIPQMKISNVWPYLWTTLETSSTSPFLRRRRCVLQRNIDSYIVLTLSGLQILASSSYDDTVKLYAADYTTDEWAVTHSLPPTPPKHYDFPNAPEPEPDESGTGHTDTVWASSFSPCGNYIATCSDDLSIKIWARFKRKEVKGEPGGAFRIGRTEKEGWYCALTISDAHDRSIFSIDWTEAGSWQPDLQTSEVVMGRIASVGGDGKINVYGITSIMEESQRCGHVIKHYLIARMEDAHGVYDINHIQWCRLGKPVPSLDSATDEKKRHRPTLQADEDVDADMNVNNPGKLQESMWQEARNMLATAADDGTVKIWLLAI